VISKGKYCPVVYDHAMTSIVRHSMQRFILPFISRIPSSFHLAAVSAWRAFLPFYRRVISIHVSRGREERLLRGSSALIKRRYPPLVVRVVSPQRAERQRDDRVILPVTFSTSAPIFVSSHFSSSRVSLASLPRDRLYHIFDSSFTRF
jgi:hypothetical protein